MVLLNVLTKVNLKDAKWKVLFLLQTRLFVLHLNKIWFGLHYLALFIDFHLPMFFIKSNVVGFLLKMLGWKAKI